MPQSPPFVERWKATLSAADKRGGTDEMIRAIEAWIDETEHARSRACSADEVERLRLERCELELTLQQLLDFKNSRAVLADGTVITSRTTIVTDETPEGRKEIERSYWRQTAPRRQRRTVIGHRTRNRGTSRRPAARRRARHIARATSSADPPGPSEPPRPGRRGDLRHVRYPIAALIEQVRP